MRILITGASGALGSAIFNHFETQGESIERFNRCTFSWQDHRTNIDKLNGIDCIIHAAANTNVEICELEPELCYRDNTLLTERLAFAASQAKCKFVYISSTGIYGMAKTADPYTEYDEVNPTTHHHCAKWLGEKAVNQYINNALILRAGWLFGGRPDHPKNFVARRIEEALNSPSQQIQSNTQQKGVPTFVDDFAMKLYELIKNGEVGTFNLVNQGLASRFDYVKKIIEFAGLNVKVLPTTSAVFNRKAQVSGNEAAVSMKLHQIGYSLLPNWQDSLEHYIKRDLNDWLAGRTKS